MSGTHLYGRRLLVEAVEDYDEDDVGLLRAKTAARSAEEGGGRGGHDVRSKTPDTAYC